MGDEPDAGARFAGNCENGRAVVDLPGDRRGRRLAGEPSRPGQGVRVRLGRLYDLARRPCRRGDLHRAPRRLRRGHPPSTRGPPDNHFPGRRASDDPITGDRFREARASGHGLLGLRARHRRRAGHIRCHRHRRPRPGGLPRRCGPPAGTGRADRVRQLPPWPVPNGDRGQRSRRASAAGSHADPALPGPDIAAVPIQGQTADGGSIRGPAG